MSVSPARLVAQPAALAFGDVAATHGEHPAAVQPDAAGDLVDDAELIGKQERLALVLYTVGGHTNTLASDQAL